MKNVGDLNISKIFLIFSRIRRKKFEETSLTNDIEKKNTKISRKRRNKKKIRKKIER